MFKQVGDYELKNRIGRGNYADVYLGVHVKTREQYAVKVISKEKFSHPKLIAGLESEVKIMKEFNHRNILSLKKYFSSANNFYLVMEYCAGGDLNKFIKKVGRLREEHAFNFLAQLAEGIAFLNEQGFIHRDLKTANVLLTEETVRATLKIADFGFARQLQSDALAQTPCGTPLYMVRAPTLLAPLRLSPVRAYSDVVMNTYRRLKCWLRANTTPRPTSGASAAFSTKCWRGKCRLAVSTRQIC